MPPPLDTLRDELALAAAMGHTVVSPMAARWLTLLRHAEADWRADAHQAPISAPLGDDPPPDGTAGPESDEGGPQ